MLVSSRHTLFSSLSTHEDLMMQAFVWHHTVQLRVIWFGASYVNLRCLS